MESCLPTLHQLKRLAHVLKFSFLNPLPFAKPDVPRKAESLFSSSPSPSLSTALRKHPWAHQGLFPFLPFHPAPFSCPQCPLFLLQEEVTSPTHLICALIISAASVVSPPVHVPCELQTSPALQPPSPASPPGCKPETDPAAGGTSTPGQAEMG